MKTTMTIAEIPGRVAEVHQAAQKIKQLEPFEFLFGAKFCDIGYDPMDKEKAYNQIEQINQSMTLLTTYWAAERLAAAEETEITINPAETNGPDVEISFPAAPGSPTVVCEIFAATFPYNNNKFFKDIKTLLKREYEKDRSYRYCMVFCSPEPFSPSRKRYGNITLAFAVNKKSEIVEGEKYQCRVNEGKTVEVIWLRPKTLRDWAEEKYAQISPCANS